MFKFKEFFDSGFYFGGDVAFPELDVLEAGSAFSDESDADSFNCKQFSLIETAAYCVVEVLWGEVDVEVHPRFASDVEGILEKK